MQNYSPIPQYYDPYKQGDAAGIQRQAQQTAQANVPFKDTSPNAQGKKGRKVRMKSPNGSIASVPEEYVPYAMQKGATYA